MDILVKGVIDKTYPNTGRCVIADIECGKHAVQVVICAQYVRVLVNNASHKAWRGMGKTFPSVDAAVANYKTGAVRSMIQTAASLAA